MPAGPVLALNDVIEIVSVCQTTDQIGLNVFHYLIDRVDPVPVTQLSSIPDQLISSGYPALLKDLISQQAAYLGIMYRVIQPVLSIQFQNILNNGLGTVAGDMLPRQVAGFIKKRSAVAGRRKSGRLYVPFPGEADSTATATPSGGYVARLDLLKNLLAANITVIGLTRAVPVIYQRPANGNPYQTRLIAEWISSSKWATQRRRGNFGRPNLSPIV